MKNLFQIQTMNYPVASPAPLWYRTSRRGIKSKKKYGIAASCGELNPLCGIDNKIISKTFWVINIILISTLMVTGFIEHSYSAESLKPEESVDSYFKQGNVYLEEGQYEKAIAAYTGAIEIKPGYADAIFNRGNAYSKSRRLDLAIKDYTLVIEIDPGNAGPYLNRGLVYSGKGEYNKAITDFTKVIEINPKQADAYHHRGISFFAQGRYDKAIADYNKTIEIDPMNATAYAGRGIARHVNSRFDKSLSGADKNIQVKRSMADINRAIEIDPKNTSVLKAEELFSSRSGELEGGAPFSEEGRDMEENDRYNRTIKEFTRSAKIDPDYSDSRFDTRSSDQEKGRYELLSGPRILAPRIAAPSPVLTRPTAPRPTAPRPAIRKPVIKKPVIKRPVVTKPVITKPVIRKPVIRKPVIIKPVIKRPVIAKPVIKKPVIKKAIVKRPVIAKPVITKPVVTKPAVTTPAGIKSIVKKPSVPKPSIPSPPPGDLVGQRLAGRATKGKDLPADELPPGSLTGFDDENVFKGNQVTDPESATSRIMDFSLAGIEKKIEKAASKIDTPKRMDKKIEKAAQIIAGMMNNLQEKLKNILNNNAALAAILRDNYSDQTNNIRDIAAGTDSFNRKKIELNDVYTAGRFTIKVTSTLSAGITNHTVTATDNRTGKSLKIGSFSSKEIVSKPTLVKNLQDQNTINPEMKMKEGDMVGRGIRTGDMVVDFLELFGGLGLEGIEGREVSIGGDVLGDIGLEDKGMGGNRERNLDMIEGIEGIEGMGGKGKGIDQRSMFEDFTGTDIYANPKGTPDADSAGYGSADPRIGSGMDASVVDIYDAPPLWNPAGATKKQVNEAIKAQERGQTGGLTEKQLNKEAEKQQTEGTDYEGSSKKEVEEAAKKQKSGSDSGGSDSGGSDSGGSDSGGSDSGGSDSGGSDSGGRPKTASPPPPAIRPDPMGGSGPPRELTAEEKKKIAAKGWQSLAQGLDDSTRPDSYREVVEKALENLLDPLILIDDEFGPGSTESGEVPKKENTLIDPPDLDNPDPGPDPGVTPGGGSSGGDGADGGR